jgi:Arc/MetJ-type ribon-helix-helix transcriptional regulator
MSITLSKKVNQMIDDRVKSGMYRTPQDVVLAAFASLEQQERVGDFAPGELDKLLAVADEEIDRGELLDGEAAFRERRRLRKRRPNPSKSE